MGGMLRRKSKPASEIVLEAVDQVGPSIARDYLLEILVLLVGVGSGVGGLKEFCSLAALMMGIDCLGLFTLYVGVLAVVVEVSQCRIHCLGAYLSANFFSPFNTGPSYQGNVRSEKGY